MTPNLARHTTAVIAALDGIELAGAEVPVEDIEARPSVTPPYYIVQPFTGSLDGPLGDGHADGVLLVMVKAVTQVGSGPGQGRASCQWLQWRAREVLIGRDTLDVEGWRTRVYADADRGVMVDRDPTPNRLFTADLYGIDTTPRPPTT